MEGGPANNPLENNEPHGNLLFPLPSPLVTCIGVTAVSFDPFLKEQKQIETKNVTVIYRFSAESSKCFN